MGDRKEPSVFEAPPLADIDRERGDIDSNDFIPVVLEIQRHPPGAAAQVQQPAGNNPAHRFLLDRIPVRKLRKVPFAFHRCEDEPVFSLDDLDSLLPVQMVQEHVSESIPVGSVFRDLVAHSSPKFARSSRDSYPSERFHRVRSAAPMVSVAACGWRMGENTTQSAIRTGPSEAPNTVLRMP